MLIRADAESFSGFNTYTKLGRYGCGNLDHAPSTKVRRLYLILSMLVVWAGIYFWGGKDTVLPPRTADFIDISDEIAAWHNMHAEERYALPDTNLVSYTAGEGTRRIRILVVGDSFTQGVGLRDRTRRWPRLLAQEVAERREGVQVEVVVLSLGGTSTYTHAEWLKAILTRQVSDLPMSLKYENLIEDPFDAVLVGYVINDVIYYPGIDDLKYLNPQPVDPDQEIEITQGGADPNEAVYREALVMIKDVTDGVPLRFLILSQKLNERVDKMFREVGIEHADLTVEQYQTGNLEDGYVVSKLDNHPAERTHLQYAEMAAEVVDSLIAVGSGTQNLVEGGLAGISIPFGASIQVASKVLTSEWDPMTWESYEQCSQKFEQRGGDWRTGAQVYSVTCDKAGEQIYSTILGEKIEGILASCDQYPHPYSGIYLDGDLRGRIGNKGRVIVETDMVEYDIYIAGYAKDGAKVERKLGTYKNRAEVFVNFETGENAIVLVGRGECGKQLTRDLAGYRLRVEPGQ